MNVAVDEQSIKSIGPWRLLKRQVVYENPWIQVSHQQVKTPADSDGIYGVVHFKSRAIGIIALDGEQHIWLVGQTRYPLNTYSWEIPEGGAPLDEDPLAAAKRELKEETGLTANKWEQLSRLHLSNSVTDEEALVYLATELSAGLANPEDTEDISCKRLSFDQALAMVERGEITDAISVTAILTLARRLSR